MVSGYDAAHHPVKSKAPCALFGEGGESAGYGPHADQITDLELPAMACSEFGLTVL